MRRLVRTLFRTIGPVQPRNTLTVLVSLILVGILWWYAWWSEIADGSIDGYWCGTQAFLGDFRCEPYETYLDYARLFNDVFIAVIAFAYLIGIFTVLFQLSVIIFFIGRGIALTIWLIASSKEFDPYIFEVSYASPRMAIDANLTLMAIALLVMLALWVMGRSSKP